ncbi:hypothetical protein T4B_13247 [Trichinella pseudospiralis]|uniref:Uncharacterized protein n=2 Tax=Trichinella pseudospiralis TaxID=6337 RepID=A0A0V1IN91_TRIPS|nr:hypothetical protein T4A_5442 [Trichinella pseudospiralis]KRY88686.1 hypothetical protein T4D_9122 [Trichinella pseudospiralis]KRZ24185.1 hypothetical protein T4B_13247 [Trichinella pseudospiralis]KRZ36191.1 hypothetical protein T4C_8214 [Trichinella pseudospiralis]
MFKYSEKCDHNTLLALNMLGIATNCNLRLTRRHESSSFIISSNHASQSRHMTESITLRNREVQNVKINFTRKHMHTLFTTLMISHEYNLL